MKLSLVHSLSFAVFDQAVFISTAIPKNCKSLEAGASLPDPFARGRHEDQSAAKIKAPQRTVGRAGLTEFAIDAAKTRMTAGLTVACAGSFITEVQS